MRDASSTSREFAFTERDFKFLSQLAKDQTGIVLNDSKRYIVYARLARRLRALKLTSFAEYRRLIEDDLGGTEISNMINAITTNLTRFFRERHHFDHLSWQVLRPLAEQPPARNRQKLRIWSAGCSTGEEAYSIAMTLAATLTDFSRWDTRILATDLDSNVLNQGAAATYSAQCLSQIPASYRQQFIVRVNNSEGKIAPGIRQLVAFKQLNLLCPWPLKQAYDAIFCRNVVIYFDNETKQMLVDRFVRQLKLGGFLYLGHAEPLLSSNEAIRLVDRTTYERVK